MAEKNSWNFTPKRPSSTRLGAARQSAVRSAPGQPTNAAQAVPRNQQPAAVQPQPGMHPAPPVVQQASNLAASADQQASSTGAGPMEFHSDAMRQVNRQPLNIDEFLSDAVTPSPSQATDAAQRTDILGIKLPKFPKLPKLSTSQSSKSFKPPKLKLPSFTIHSPSRPTQEAASQPGSARTVTIDEDRNTSATIESPRAPLGWTSPRDLPQRPHGGPASTIVLTPRQQTAQPQPLQQQDPLDGDAAALAQLANPNEPSPRSRTSSAEHADGSPTTVQPEPDLDDLIEMLSTTFDPYTGSKDKKKD